EAPPLVPKAFTRDPGAFVSGVPAMVSLPLGLRVNSVPGPDEKPQAFETVEAVEARAQWNAMPALADEARVPAFGSRVAWLAGTASGLKAGDMVLFVGAEFEADATSNRWDRRVLSAVEPDDEHRRTRIVWDEPLGSVTPPMATATPPVAYALRERAAIFGHNAPQWRAMSAEFKKEYLGGAGDPGDWPGFDIYAPAATPAPAVLSARARNIGFSGLFDEAIGVFDNITIGPIVAGGSANAANTISLDREYAAIVSGSYLVLDKGDYTELFKATTVSHGSRAEFAVSGKSTAVKLAGQNLALFANQVRQTAVFAKSEALPFARAPIASPLSGASLAVAADVRGLEAGRRVIVQGPRSDGSGELVHAATLVSATPAASNADGGVLVIDPPLPAPLQREGTVVFGNVALARHGETVAELLGSGDAALPHARFQLRHQPLSYRAAPTPAGVASELTVRVNDVAWTEREMLYGAGATDRAYTVVTDEQGRVWVQFGDGERGARPPSGSNNLRASYRKGLGVAGNVAAQSLTQASTRPLGFKSVANPLPALGGTDAEPADAARRSIPLFTRTLGRAVSVLDYEDFARAFAGIAKASATVLSLPHGPTVAVTVAGMAGAALTPDNPVWRNLLGALRASGDPHVGLRLLTHAAHPFNLGLKVKVDPAYESKPVLAAVEAALRAAFSFDARELGQPVQQSEVIAVAHGVPGVIAIDLDFLYGGSAPPSQTLKSRQARLLATHMHVSNGVPKAAEILTLHPGPFDRLELMP
ncbi:MAG: putative baseplate assembly protein, partial [Bacteroidia bacterium]